MRQAFMHTLTTLAKKDPRILLITGDLGYGVVDLFRKTFPDRFYNVGVAEQNMVGIATGLAEAGFLPFVYSIVPFAVLRPYEFIRNGPILHRLPVRIVGIGGGFDYGTNGLTHYGLEDIGVMRAQPDIMVIAPSDEGQTRNALLATWDMPGPIYYRLSKDETRVVPGLNGRFETGRAQVIREGKDIIFITMGSVTNEVTDAAAALSGEGISCAIVVVASLSPPPVEDLIGLLSRFRVALTVEAHYITGGLGSLVAEIVAENGLNCRLIRCGAHKTPHGEIGSQAYLRQINGLSSGELFNLALSEREKEHPCNHH
jgi:transketolase